VKCQSLSEAVLAALGVVAAGSVSEAVAASAAARFAADVVELDVVFSSAAALRGGVVV